MEQHGGLLEHLPLGNAYPTFSAAIHDNDINTCADVLANREDYQSLVTGGTGDIVRWNHWDEDYNTAVFDPFIENVFGVDHVTAVQLLVPGVYLIRAQIDWTNDTCDSSFMNSPFTTWLGTNFDESITENAIPYFEDQHLCMWTVSATRIVWPFFVGAEDDVEIVAAHDHPTEDQLYIPGGFSGFWAFPPMLRIVYLGGLDAPLDFFDSVA